MIRFLKHKVVNDSTKASARVFYSIDATKKIYLYAKDYGRDLEKVFAGTDVSPVNQSDSMVDYFENSTAHIEYGHKFWSQAFERLSEKDKAKLAQEEEFDNKVKESSLMSYKTLLHKIGVKSPVLHTI